MYCDPALFEEIQKRKFGALQRNSLQRILKAEAWQFEDLDALHPTTTISLDGLFERHVL